MVYCTVCMNSNKKNRSLSFFCYPKDSAKRHQWLKTVGREDLISITADDKNGEQYRICEEHFEESCIRFSKNKTRKYLCDKAFPSLKLPENERACSRLNSETFVMRLTKCVCCLEKDAEVLLWAERPHVGSYGDLIKELFGVQFPVPDSVSNATRICGACAADVDRAFEVRTRMLEAQATLATAHWLIPPPQLTIPPPRRIGTSRKLHSAGKDDSYKILEVEPIHEKIHDIDERVWKTEVDMDDHDVGAVSEATRSLVSQPSGDAHTVQGTRKRTAKSQAIPAQSFLEQESQTYELMDTTEEPYVTAELDDVKLEPDPLGEDTELCQETDQMKRTRMADVNSKTKRKGWSSEHMAEAIKLVREKKMGYLRAAKHFGVPRSTLFRLCQKNELPPEEAAVTTLGRKTVLGKSLENILVDYILMTESKFNGLTRNDVRKMAYMLARRHQLEKPFGDTGMAGKKWLKLFLKRHKDCYQ